MCVKLHMNNYCNYQYSAKLANANFVVRENHASLVVFHFAVRSLTSLLTVQKERARNYRNWKGK